MPLTRIVGVLFTAFGAMFLLYLFLWSTLVPPDLKGAAWWAAVFHMMFGPGAILGTMVGIVCVGGGLILILQRAGRRPSIFAIVLMAVLAAVVLTCVVLS